ncbi:FmdB family zinc ribbon protein [Hyphomonas sp.]|uniref:FmdB family zinc ribbon protein n=1 Tax=Hyphomonas sp. TaxID=87 RepID=UPI000C8C2156|nr:FmdB family zinc ribbon protein [Hyphomonas sp.]MAL45798.1 hypothetical protein [Hyphomonas sp.]
MPRYQYNCKECNTISNFFHLSDEVETDCPKCGMKDTLKKVLTKFRTDQKSNKKQKVGNLTEEFIEDSRQELQQQKNELNKDR